MREAISAAELMHGPLALAGPDFPVLMFSQDDAALGALKEMAAGLAGRGVPVIAAGSVSNWAGDGSADRRRASSLRAADRAGAELLSAGRGGGARPRPRSRPPPHLRKVTETR